MNILEKVMIVILLITITIAVTYSPAEEKVLKRNVHKSKECPQ